MNKILEDKIWIIPASDNRDRKYYHSYMEQNYPDIYKTSLKCNYFGKGDIIMHFKECFECEYKKVLLNKSYPGYLENNRDASIYGTCPRCDTITEFESGYDDYDDEGLSYVHENNIIAIGQYFKGYCKPSRAGYIEKKLDIELDSIPEIYEINAPLIERNRHGLEKKMSKREIQRYINNEFKLDRYTRIV